jgi:hypothetical protein
MSIRYQPDSDPDALIPPLRRLYIYLISFPTATEALTAWLERSGVANAVIEARVLARSIIELPETTLAMRRVQLVYGSSVLSDAVIAYRADVLTPLMRRRLATTNTPFGEVVKSLSPYRQMTHADTTSKQLYPGDEKPSPHLEMRATIFTPDHGAIAKVRERYSDTVLATLP